MEFVEDFFAFMADFAFDAEVGSASLRGIFDNGHANAFDVIAGTLPTLLIATADAINVTRNDAVVIGMDRYTITDIKPDGTGMTRLILRSV